MPTQRPPKPPVEKLTPPNPQSDLLVSLKGRAGLFIPLPETTADAANLCQNPEKLQAMLKALREEITRLSQENGKLQQALDALNTPPQSADDLAGAMQHTVDTLQTRLGSLRNTVSNFAVREFRLESNVRLDVNPLGQAVYRFIKPGETVNDLEVSRITLDLVPLPKQSAAGSYTSAAFTPDLGIEEIDGIGEAFRKRLNRSSLYTVGELLQAASRARTKVELATMLGVDRVKLGDWLAQAELLTIREIDGRTARVLVGLGITSLEQLARQSPEKLTSDFNALAAKRQLKGLSVTSAHVQIWIATARTFVTGSQEKAPDTGPVK